MSCPDPRGWGLVGKSQGEAGGAQGAQVTITHHGLKCPCSTQDGNQITLAPRNALPPASPRSAVVQVVHCYSRPALLGEGRAQALTRSLTSGIGFLLRMSGMLSMMMRPPPGLRDIHTGCQGAMFPSSSTSHHLRPGQDP